MMTRSDPRLWD